MIRILRENNNEIRQIPLECIKCATLLSTEEAENLLTIEERKCKGTQEAINNGLFVADNGNSCYWLRSAGYSDGFACIVSFVGCVYNYYSVRYPNIGIRPALILNLQSSNLRVGDGFEFGDYTFKIISNSLALCDVIIDVCPFNQNKKDGNDYETSCIKKKVDEWFNQCIQDIKDISQGLKTDKMIADEMDLGF